MRVVENGAARLEARDMPAADAIVVLSEGRMVAPGRAAISEWGDGDRFWGGVALYHAGKAPLLVFTGGGAPWQPEAKPEGELLMAYAKTLDVPPHALRTTGPVVNTAEEAREVATLLGQQGEAEDKRLERTRVLLVTSAFHMPRSQRLFINAGLDVIPYPVDFKAESSQDWGVMDFLPNAHAFQQTETACRELIGRAYYMLR